ncbi:hypothetical protein ABZ413_24615 [Nocardia rhamnosiphila]|uniref:hypothetical protein n=1 Tax=Nocardia rhamnosiphila TaxID=426716 RepID=UPI0033EBDC10
MAEIISADTHNMRMQGADEHGRVQPLQDQAKVPEEWLANFHDMFGYAADEFLSSATHYMVQREIALNTVADGHQKSGDTLYLGASQFEDVDNAEGGRIARNISVDE